MYGERRLTKTDLWKAAGLSSSAVSHWFAGSNEMDLATAMKVAPLLRCNPHWLFDGSGSAYKDIPEAEAPAMPAHPATTDEETEKTASDADIFTIPHIAASGSMGPGIALADQDEVIERMTLKGDWLRKNAAGCQIDDLAIISGKGNSMFPTFSDGDLLLVDTGSRRVDVDGVYVLSAHGRLFIKTVRQRMDGSYEISSDNPSVKTVDVLNGEHEVVVHGRVVWAWNGKKL